MAKRAATSVLDRDNWDKEEEPEDPGVFQKASSEVLQTRVIRTAKRRIQMSDNSSETKQSPFLGFAGFGKTTSGSNTTSPFSFLNQAKPGSSNKDNNGTGLSLNKDASSSPVHSLSSSSITSQKEIKSSDSSDSIKSLPISTEPSFKPFEHLFKGKAAQTEGGDRKKSDSLELLKDLNLSCSKWITEHLEKNPYCILTPIFKDYEKHLVELNLNGKQGDRNENDGEKVTKNVVNSNNNEKLEQSGSDKLSLPSQKPFSFLKNDKVSDLSPSKTDKETENKDQSTEFKPGGFQSATPFNFQFGAHTKFDSSAPFSLNSIAAKPIAVGSENKKDDDESEEPPKNEFVPVVEEDSVFDIKCKVFVKKEGNFVSRGVGTLFLKPVKETGKTQVVVRAHTNLGNILLNFILSADVPVQKTGKNNAMLVCIPTPETKPPPVPVLIRVKTSEECDTLIKKLEESKKST